MAGLATFIKNKLQEYQEPQRAGTPKGDTIGISRNEYHVCLQMLTKKRAVEIARDLKVNYALVRRWKLEKNFLELYEKLKAEFLLLVNSKLMQLDDENFDEKEILEFFSDGHMINPEIIKTVVFTMEIYSQRVKGHRLLLLLCLLKELMSKDRRIGDNVNIKIKGLIKVHGMQLLSEYKQVQFKEVTEAVFNDLLLLALLFEGLEP